jgi:hypothetical protein
LVVESTLARRPSQAGDTVAEGGHGDVVERRQEGSCAHGACEQKGSGLVHPKTDPFVIERVYGLYDWQQHGGAKPGLGQLQDAAFVCAKGLRASRAVGEAACELEPIGQLREEIEGPRVMGDEYRDVTSR